MIFILIFIAFLVSLFVGPSYVCIGLGVAVTLMSLLGVAIQMGWLD